VKYLYIDVSENSAVLIWRR